MNKLILGIAVLGGLILAAPPANATPCTYGTWYDYATGTTHYVWFHEGEFVGMTPGQTPPPECQPH